MRKLIIVAILSLVVSFPACGILVDAVDDTASKALGASHPFMGSGAWWKVEGGTRYKGGSCTLVRNNSQDGAWVLTAGHAVLTDGEVHNIMRYTFRTCHFDGFTRGTSSYVASRTVAAIHDKVFLHPSQDIALVKLESLVRDAAGELVTPIEMYSGDLSLTYGQPILFGGAGDTGTPDQGGSEGTSYRDGFERCARGVFVTFNAARNEGLLEFKRSVPIPGMGSNGDSGGFAAVEFDGNVMLVGVLVTVSGSGEAATTGFEFLGYDDGFSVWLEDIIIENRETQSGVGNWDVYE